MSRLRALVVLALGLFVTEVFGQQEEALARDDVASVKKKLVALFDALGQLPPGYAKESEDFYLPTETSKNKSQGLYRLLRPSASRKYAGTAKKEGKTAQKDFEKEYKKKIAEAQAKGDYQAMSKLAQEMQQKAGQMALKEAETEEKEPINVHVRFNANPNTTIDPDAVVFESPGVIGLRLNWEEGAETGRIGVYFDPISLKDTKQLSKIDLKEPEGGTGRKVVFLNATIELSGPPAEIETWAKKIDVKKVLAQIDSGK